MTRAPGAAVTSRRRLVRAGRRVEPASFSASGAEVAAAFGDEPPVKYERMPAPDDNEDLRRMAEFFDQGGYTVDIPALHAEHPDLGWHTLDDWIKTKGRPALLSE